MIAGNEAEILTTVETLMMARSQLRIVESSGASRFEINAGERAYITRSELIKVLKARVSEFEQKAHDLGVYGPGARDTAKASAMALIHSNNPRPTQ